MTSQEKDRYTALLNKLEDLLDIHRAKDEACEPECFCYEIEEALLREREK